MMSRLAAVNERIKATKALLPEQDGAVVGSALVREIEEHSAGGDVANRVAVFTRWLKGAAA